MDHHAWCAIGGTGRRQIAASFYFHHAKAAGSGFVLYAGAFKVDVAQRWDFNADLLTGFKYCSALWHLHYMIVYCELNHILFHDESAVRLENLDCIEMAT